MTNHLMQQNTPVDPRRIRRTCRVTPHGASVIGLAAVLFSCQIRAATVAPLNARPPLVETLEQMAVPLPPLSPRPSAVQGVKRPVFSLNGTWRFNPVLPADPGTISGAAAASWEKITVPGEWVMQGFKVETNEFACYVREFTIPTDWPGQCLKLRFDAVHSECKVWFNGREVGGHEGDFVPFEFDVTDAAKRGRNLLVVAVKSESVSDVLDSATQYAGHQLGGITRKVTLFAVPKAHIAAQVLTTRFDSDFKDAMLTLRLEIANESAAGADSMLSFTLAGPDGRPVAINPASIVVRLPPATDSKTIRPGQTFTQEFSIPVTAPRQWDTEHPHLYTLRTELKTGGQSSEVITQAFGFRQVEIRGNQVFVNNHPIKLHGVCRHETHPLLGRSLTPELWRQDAEIFRDANVNYIRTSHYPPAEEFLDACDELGIFVECESALCWVQFVPNPVWQTWDYQDPKFFPYLMRANLENIIANRNHPSVIIWSLANESRWSPLFAEVLGRVKQLDPSRPTSFHDQCWGKDNNAGSQADIAVYHYPKTNSPAECDQGSRPTLFGEYCHVETYNHCELFTDPGVRDQWGPRFAEMYDLMHLHPGCLGGAIWSGIDDVFQLPDGQVEGYGGWGVIDGWRRAKPETFHVKKAYSPVRVTTREVPDDGPLKIAVENRYDFANLNEIKIEWMLGKEHGTTTADVPPHSAGEINIMPKSPAVPGQPLRLKFTDPRGFICEGVELPAGKPSLAPPPKPLKPGRLALETSDEIFTVKGAEFACEFSRRTGQIRKALVNGKPVLVGGPVLMMLPMEAGHGQPHDLTKFGVFNPVCKDWSASSVTAATEADGSAVVKAEGDYSEAAGGYTLRIQPDGALEFSYDFTSKQAVNPRQVGMVFYTARDCDTLAWRRDAEWSDYPADHIGRPVGEARANPNDATHAIYLASEPKNGWSQDATALGTADFRSSKSRVVFASLRNQRNSGIALVSDGSQSVRAFVDGGRIGWLIACINTGGNDGFFAPHHAADRRPLNKGSKVSGAVHLQFIEN